MPRSHGKTWRNVEYCLSTKQKGMRLTLNLRNSHTASKTCTAHGIMKWTWNFERLNDKSVLNSRYRLYCLFRYCCILCLEMYLRRLWLAGGMFWFGLGGGVLCSTRNLHKQCQVLSIIVRILKRTWQWPLFKQVFNYFVEIFGTGKL